jgi:hypothetical protein
MSSGTVAMFCNLSRTDDIVQIDRTLQTEVGLHAPNCDRTFP